MKRNITIALIILILITALFLSYFVYYKNRAGRQNEQTNGQNQNQIGTIENQFLKRFADFPAVGAGLSPDKSKIRFFDRTTGNLFEANFDGTGLAKISDSLLDPKIADIVWSPQKNMFAGLFENSIQNFIYTFSSSKSLFLGKQISSLSFSPTQKQIIYQEELGTGNQLVSANINDSQRKIILSGAFPKLNLQWLKTGEIAAWPFPSGLIKSFLIKISPTGKITKVFDNTNGLSVKFSPDEKKIIITNTDSSGKNSSFKTALSDGTGQKEWGIKTIAEKCVWLADNRNIICAVPETIPNSAIMPDDYFKGLIDSNDRLVKIDTLTFIANAIDLGGAQVSANELIVSPQEDYLIFINQKDGLLYTLKL